MLVARRRAVAGRGGGEGEQRSACGQPGGLDQVAAGDGQFHPQRRAGVTVLVAALELVQSGLDAISMRALGARLGADPTAVYRYFRTKDELLDAMAEAVVASDRPFPQTGQLAEDLAAAF